MTFSRHQAVGAYQRWELPTFDGGAEQPAEPAVEEASQPAEEKPLQIEAGPPPDFQLPTADDIEAMLEQARVEGRAAGYSEGHSEGYSEGAGLARAEADRLAGLGRTLDEALTRLDQEIADDILALAIEIARQMVGHTLAVNPSAVTDTVRAALVQMPQHQVRIHLNPADVALIRQHLSEALEQGHHRIVEDAGVTAGGCRLEAAGAEIDATVETRWRRIMESLGHSNTTWSTPD